MTLIQLQPGRIRRTHFEEYQPRAMPARYLAQMAQQFAAVAAPLQARGNAQVEQVRLVYC